MGTTATILMACATYFGWWYQKLSRHRFTSAVEGMHPHAPQNLHSADGMRRQRAGMSPGDRDSQMEPLIRQDSTQSGVERTDHSPARSRRESMRSQQSQHLSPDWRSASPGIHRVIWDEPEDDIALLPLEPSPTS